MMDQDEDSQPKDLSMKCNKKMKPIPPPLNLGEHLSTLKEFAIIATSPKSPLMQKNLPFRKRAHSLSGVNEVREQQPDMVDPVPTQSASVIKAQIVESESSEENASYSILGVLEPASTTPPVSTVAVTLSQTGSSYSLCHTSHYPVMTAGGDVASYTMSGSPGIAWSQPSAAYSPSWSPTLGHVNTTSASSVLLSPAGSSREELSGSLNMHPWPMPAWHCFQPGTLIKVDMPNGGNGSADLFRLAEELGPADWVGALRLDQVEEDLSVSHLSLRFCCLGTGVFLTAQCHTLHTFFVKDKGWCAVYPEQVAMHYHVSCRLLERGDICCTPQSVLSPDICDRFKRFSFPPEEMNVSAPLLLSPPSSPCKKPVEAERPKRPMNGFMLFAKRYRLELIQRHPGKDNRAISVILGEAWRKLPPAEKEEYVLEARAMAQEQKRLHPDCWKRKRSHSTS